MGRKPLLAPEEKRQMCKQSLETRTITSLARNVGIDPSTLKRWVKEYTIHGEQAFARPAHERTYSKAFKEQLIDEYYEQGCSLAELQAKHQVSLSVIARWIRSWDNGNELRDDHAHYPEVYAMKSRTMSPQEKLDVVSWVLSHEKDYTGAAFKFSLPYATVYAWTKTYLHEGAEGFEKVRGRRKNTAVEFSTLSKEEQLEHQIKELMAKNQLLQGQLDALKKKEQMENERSVRKQTVSKRIR